MAAPSPLGCLDRLPSELRDQIYDEIITPCSTNDAVYYRSPSSTTTQSNKSLRPTPFDLPILRASRQISDEVKQRICAHLITDIDISTEALFKKALRWLEVVSSRHSRNFGEVHLRLNHEGGFIGFYIGLGRANVSGLGEVRIIQDMIPDYSSRVLKVAELTEQALKNKLAQLLWSEDDGTLSPAGWKQIIKTTFHFYTKFKELIHVRGF